MRNLVVIAYLAGCAAHSEAVAPAGAINPPAPEIASEHVGPIRAAATSFTKWGRVDERPNIAPVLCRIPTREDYGSPSHLRMSAPKRGPHARKLYYLWANDNRAYMDDHAEIPVGFAIVKESFAAVLVDPAHPPSDPHAGGHFGLSAGEHGDPYDASIRPHAVASVPTGWGEQLTTGEPTGLFVMIKRDDSPTTDDGWIYGTVAPDGTVTSAGRVASCMSCHVKYTRRERLFGLRPAPR